MTERVEYKRVSIVDIELEKRLIELGRDGWELVSRESKPHRLLNDLTTTLHDCVLTRKKGRR